MRLYEIDETKKLTPEDFYFYNYSDDESPFYLSYKNKQALGTADIAIIPYNLYVKDYVESGNFTYIVIKKADSIIIDGEDLTNQILIISQEDAKKISSVDPNKPEQIDIEKFILENCQPYIKENPEWKTKPIYRGFSESMNNYFVKPVRQNRIPRDSSKSLHDFLNYTILEANLVANRSNSIFCSGRYGEVSEYGYPYIIFPIGKFHYTWSNIMRDAYSFFDEKKIMPIDTETGYDFVFNKHLYMSPYEAPFKEEDIQKLIDSYHGDDSSLADAIDSENEIMISCSNVLYIKPRYFEKIFQKHSY